MPVSCSAVGCSVRWRKGAQIGFFRFPYDNIRRKLWTNAVKRVSLLDGRTWEPSPYDRVCGMHFISGKPSTDKKHPDYIPSVFSFSPKPAGSDKKLSRFNRAQQRDPYLHVPKKALTPIFNNTPIEDDTDLITEESRDTDPTEPSNEQADIDNVVHEETVTTYESDDSDAAMITTNDHDYTTVLAEDLTPPAPVTIEYEAEPFYEADTVNRDDAVSDDEYIDVDVDHEKENLRERLSQTQKEYQRLLDENRVLKEKANSSKFTFNNLSDSQISTYTGLPSVAVFKWVLKITSSAFSKNRTLCPGDQLLLVLMKLRLALLNEDLAHRFQISKQLVSLLLNECLPIMAEKLKFLIKWPERDVILRNLPKSFKKQRNYRNCSVIIDCSEVFIERPLDLTARAQTWSNYKHHNTLKFLIGITPYGTVSFLSKCWVGRVSDKEITQKSGFYDKIQHGDLVLADRGFLISDELAVRGASLAIPAFTKGKNQLSQKEVETSRRLARYRIHVERAIRRIKTYSILSSVLSISLLPHADSIITLCAALTNLLPRLVS